MAIWKCEVFLSAFDWRQTFTFVCVHWPSIWPEGELASIEGSITPAIDTSELQDAHDDSESSLTQYAPVSPLRENLSDAVTQVEGTATVPASQRVLEQESREPSFSLDLMSYMPGMDAISAEPDIAEVSVEVAADVEPEVRPAVASHAMELMQEAESTAADEEKSDVVTEDEALTASSVMLQKFDARSATPAELGEAFYQWVDAVLKGGVHPVNRQGAMFHRLEQGMLVVSPGAF
ncbi:hypothetical protein, partial [Vibrio ichthyoenteri]